MKDGARLQAVLDIIDRIITDSHVPADAIVNDYVRQRRFIGSADRRYITDTLYAILRRFLNYKGYCSALKWHGDTARSLVLCHLHQQKYDLDKLAEIFNDMPHHPTALKAHEIRFFESLNTISMDQLSEAEQLGVLEWSLQCFKDKFPDTYINEIEAYNSSAPLDLRINSLKAEPQKVYKALKDDGLDVSHTPLSPIGLRIQRRVNLSQHALIVDGSIEIQDEGSQLVALLVNAKPGMAVIDYCAGAGGKTLAMAADMKNKGRIVATDAIAWRLERSKERFKRAGVFNAECRALTADTQKWLKRQEGRFDRVLVDVPCSGSGTWRRNPDLRWRMKEEDVNEIIVKQQEILDKAKRLVKPGGRLVYATCSVYKCENHDQINRFLTENPEFEIVPVPKIWQDVFASPCPTQESFLQLTPHQNDTDGFFVAILERTMMPLKLPVRSDA